MRVLLKYNGTAKKFRRLNHPGRNLAAIRSVRSPRIAFEGSHGVALPERLVIILAAIIRFARFFSFRFRTRPRTFYGASERFAKPRIEMFTTFSSRATPYNPLQVIRRLRTDRTAARLKKSKEIAFQVHKRLQTATLLITKALQKHTYQPRQAVLEDLL